jgi:hypothetical protein
MRSALVIVNVLICMWVVAAAQAEDAMFGDDVSEQLRNEIQYFGAWENPDAAAARQRIVDRGESATPEVLAALEDIVQALGRYDPKNLGANKDSYQLLMMQQNHLMAVLGSIGNASHADQLVAIALQMDPNNMLAVSVYDTLDSFGAREQANAVAAAQIANPKSRDMQLLAAMTRFWLQTPSSVAESVTPHFDAALTIERAMAYKLAVNGGRGEEVRERLIAEVATLNYAESGNKQMLFALAAVEKPDVFLPRMEPLRLRRHVKSAATKYSRFIWSDVSEQELLLKDLLGTEHETLTAEAMRFMLEHNRGDLMTKYSLAWPEQDPFVKFSAYLPGIDLVNMSRQQRLEYFDEEWLTALEREQASPRGVIMNKTIKLIVDRLGYKLIPDGQKIVVTRP